MQASHDKYDHVRERIKAHEGLRLMRYVDSLGYPTIGYGHALTPDEIRHGTWDKISRAEADAIFEGDFREAMKEAKRIFDPIWHHINAARQGVLIEMTYQLGPVGVGRFKKMWKALNTYDYRLAAVEMLNSQWAKQTTERCCILALIMLRGEDIGQRVGDVKA